MAETNVFLWHKPSVLALCQKKALGNTTVPLLSMIRMAHPCEENCLHVEVLHVLHWISLVLILGFFLFMRPMMHIFKKSSTSLKQNKQNHIKYIKVYLPAMLHYLHWLCKSAWFSTHHLLILLYLFILFIFANGNQEFRLAQALMISHISYISQCIESESNY